MDLMVGLLGSFVVVRDGESHAIASRLQRRFLLRLALAGGTVPKDDMVDALWGDAPPASAASTLKTHAGKLRKLLRHHGAPVLVGHRGGYELCLDREEVDARRFEELVTKAEGLAPAEVAETLREALALWRAAMLGDVWEAPFAAVEARRLEELRRIALERRIEADLAMGRHREVVGDLEGLVADDPLREQRHLLLMTALYRSGRQAEALAAAATLRTLLRVDLGIDPSPAVVELEQAILEQRLELSLSPASKVVARDRLPRPPVKLVGRDGALAEIGEKLLTHRLLVLTGTGGIGKTCLALAAAAQRHAEFPDGAAFVDLSLVTDPGVIPQVIATALDAPPASSPRDTLAQIADWIGDGRVLLVVDNCEHLVTPVATALQTLLAACPQLTVLATSRESLGVPGESDWPVSPLAVHADGTAGVAPAVQLFLERANAVRPGFQLSDPTTITRICAALDGLPLAIELAAARVIHLSPAQIAERLGERFGLLTAPGGADGRHRTLAATVDWSYGLLSPGEQALFNRLGVFPGSFSLEAAEAVCPDDGVEQPTVLDGLRSLVRKSLVDTEDHGTVVRYRLLETTREYARRQAGTRSDMQRRHLDWVLGWLELLPAEEATLSTEAAERFRTERANLRAAMEAAAALGRLDLVARVLATTGALWRQGGGGDFDECGRWLEVALPAAAPDVAAACHVLGAFRARMSSDDVNAHAAQRYHSETAPGRNSEASGFVACHWANLAFLDSVESAMQQRPDLADRADGHARQALTLLADIPPPWRLPVAWDIGMGLIARMRLADACDILASAVPDPSEVVWKFRIEESLVRACLALALHLDGNLAAARRIASPAVAIVADDTGGTNWMTTQPNAFLAVVLAADGDLATADRLARERVRVAAKTGGVLNTSDFLIALGAIAVHEGDWERAARLLGAARQMGKRFPYPFRTPMGAAVYAHYNAQVRQALEPARSAAARREGTRMTLAEAVEHALGH